MNTNSRDSEAQQNNLEASVKALHRLLRDVAPHSNITEEALSETLRRWKTKVNLARKARILELKVKAIDRCLRQYDRQFGERMEETQARVGRSLRRAARSNDEVLPRWYGLLQQFPWLSAVFETPAVACFDIDFSNLQGPPDATSPRIQRTPVHHDVYDVNDLEMNHETLSSAATHSGSQEPDPAQGQRQRRRRGTQHQPPREILNRQDQEAKREVLHRQSERYRQLQEKHQQTRSMEELIPQQSMPGSFIETSAVPSLTHASTATVRPFEFTSTSSKVPTLQRQHKQTRSMDEQPKSVPRSFSETPPLTHASTATVRPFALTPNSSNDATGTLTPRRLASILNQAPHMITVDDDVGGYFSDISFVHQVPFRESGAGARQLRYDGGHAGSDVWSSSDGVPSNDSHRHDLQLD